LALVDEVIHGKNPRVTAGLAPFSAYTLSKNLLRILAHHAIQLQIPLHLHAALSFGEMEFFYDSLGEISAFLFQEAGWREKVPPPHKMTPIQYLHEIGFLKARPALVGCLHLGPTDAALLNQNGCLRVFAPRAFEYLEVGEVPWLNLFREKVPWALGTMGVAAGSNLDLWDEMRTVLYAVDVEDRDGLANWILQAATRWGAAALGMGERIGTLASGKRADVLVVDTPEDDDSLAAGLIDQTREENIQGMYVEGIKVSRSS
jgi:cytosine/adenosine deaminase-related metal-dependent hydrolase